MVRIIDALERGEHVKPGTQNGRLNSAPAGNERTLTHKPYGPGEFCVPEFR